MADWVARMIQQGQMFALLSNCGRIKDIELGLSWDSATLVEEVGRRAAVLAQMGIGRGSIVAIAHGGTAQFFADLFATWSVGAAAACLNSTLTSGELENVVNFASCSILLVNGRNVVDSLSVPIVELDSMCLRSAPIGAWTINLNDTALLLFTSGTTGTPKGVVLTFSSLLARINANITAIGAEVLAQSLVTLPTFFGHGLIGNALTPLFAGGTIVLHPRGMPLINNLGPIIDENGITFMSSVPSLWRMALTCSPRPTGRSLARVHIGSAPLSADLWSEVAAWSGAEVVNCYGITETANWIAGASSREDGIADGLVGKMWGGSAGIMDESGSVRNNGTGEIVIKSSCLMSGYFKRPDLTAAAFSNGWFRTGDQGLIDEHSRIWITGRIKDEINRGGFKVQPAEIDALLESHPAVVEACVFGIPDPMGGEAIAAAIRLAKGENVSPLSLQSWCRQRLRRAAVPEHWFFVSEIPRNARGKVSRGNVRHMLTRNEPTDKPKTEPEKPKNAAIAIVGTFISDPLFPALRFALEKIGLLFDVRAAPYHQVLHELHSSTSLLATNASGINVVIVRFEDFVREVESIDDSRVIISKTALELRKALSDHTNRTKVPTLLAVLSPSPRVPKALLPDIDSANEALSQHAFSLPGLILVSQEDIDLMSSEDRYDKLGDEIAHVPFTEAHYAAIALAIVRKVHAFREPEDETPWQGALSDGRNLVQALRTRGKQSRTLSGSPAMPVTDTERRLLDMWETILGTDGLGVEDDYFALGGTSLMAARLFTEISRRFAVRLPLSTILESTTVRALARHLDQKRALPRGQLIDLKRGGPRNLFIVHDGVGETLLYLNLALRMPNDLTVIGIKPRRIPGVPVAHVRVEDMAAFYVEEVRKVQPNGPYLFAGMCSGGVIAYEMASQLVGTGEDVKLVALLDAVTPQAPKKAGIKQRLGRLKQVLEVFKEGELTLAQRAKIAVLMLYRKFVNSISWEVYRNSRKLFVRARFRLLRELLSRDASWPSFVPSLSAYEILISALAHYAPKPLSIHSVVLARATSGEANDTPYSRIYSDAALGWSSIAQNLTVVDVDGGHSSMLQEPFVDSLAGILKPYVQ